ncbi:MAG: GAF domain-containing protein [Candidatus Cloacimonetes bacterium]|nr:GAF domain-containing protein [Candidatus Cloacimonadota bacterium]
MSTLLLGLRKNNADWDTIPILCSMSASEVNMDYTFSTNHRVNKTLNLVVQSIAEMAEDQIKHIQQLTRIGQSLSSETDLDKIFEMILNEGIAFTKADGATIYRVSDDNRFLEFELVYNATLNMRQGGSNDPIGWKPVPLYDEEGNPVMSYIVSAVYHNKKSLCFDDVYNAEGYDISGTIHSDQNSHYRCKAMLTIPLKDHEDTVLGVIQFINPLNDEKEIISFTDEHKTMLSSLSSQAAIALSNRKLIASLENLLMQFMRSIASAIERKSKYSSDHITRVAAITDMIAERINATSSGPFASVFFNEDELKEISMAGWMHDIGKIITPEFVMDKSCKLERIMDGFALIKSRVDHLKTLMKYLSLKLSPTEYQAFIQEKLGCKDEDPIIFLDDALEFISKLNIGGEFVPDAQIERMESLAAIDFTYEDQRFYLLDESDKKNLSIRKGTLNSEEMKIMRAHVSVTWEMLSQLTFPKKYGNVAFYASTHHEALNGKGYPRGLGSSALPLQSRMIAVADIFEALTSADRPYKKAKTLSESLMIIAFMTKDGHLDADLVDFFIDSGLYLEFAQKAMQPEQIDEVNISAIKSKYHLD